jgi:ankyrin repeat protein
LPNPDLLCLPAQDFVKQLLAHNVNTGMAAGDDMNALHFAAQKGHLEVVRQLINAGKHLPPAAPGPFLHTSSAMTVQGYM